LLAEAAVYGRVDSPPKMLGGRDLSVIISPLPRDKRPKLAPAPARPLPADVPAKPDGTVSTDSNTPPSPETDHENSP
jgi:hypothetical protein